MDFTGSLQSNPINPDLSICVKEPQLQPFVNLTKMTTTQSGGVFQPSPATAYILSSDLGSVFCASPLDGKHCIYLGTLLCV